MNIISLMEESDIKDRIIQAFEFWCFSSAILLEKYDKKDFNPKIVRLNILNLTSELLPKYFENFVFDVILKEVQAKCSSSDSIISAGFVLRLSNILQKTLSKYKIPSAFSKSLENILAVSLLGECPNDERSSELLKLYEQSKNDYETLIIEEEAKDHPLYKFYY